MHCVRCYSVYWPCSWVHVRRAHLALSLRGPLARYVVTQQVLRVLPAYYSMQKYASILDTGAMLISWHLVASHVYQYAAISV